MDNRLNTDNDRKRKVVVHFLRTLLPPTGSLHRNASNELNYVSTTISRVMLQHMGFRVDFHTLCEALEETGHIFFRKEGRCRVDGSMPTTHLPSQLFSEEGTAETATPALSTPSAATEPSPRVHTDLPSTIKLLRLTTIPTPSGTSPEKALLLQQTQESLARWKQKWQEE